MPRLIGAVLNPVLIPEVITTFNSSGTLTTQPTTTSVEYLVVAGGGSGGGGTAGGGGAGGFRTATGFSVSPATSYPITIGAGGAGVTSSVVGNDGSNSVFSSITSEGCLLYTSPSPRDS